MKKILLAIIAVLGLTTNASAQKFLDIYSNGKIVSSIKAADVDSMVVSGEGNSRSLDFFHNGEAFHHTLTANVDSIKVFRAGEAVDLGLPSGTLWASCNVGARNPEDYGDYFAWGETMPKENYSSSTYKWCAGDYDKLTKYCYKSGAGNNGFTDNKTELDLEDDAAYVNWGSSWRMPNLDQINELIDNCNWEWTQLNGVWGRKATSKKNGNSIFLPAAGWRVGPSLDDAGSYGLYWSRSLSTSYPYGAYLLYFNSGSVDWGYSDRLGGQSVRPVRR